MSGAFQPVAMTAAIVERRLLSAAPDLAALAKTTHNLRALASSAIGSNLDLMGWIAPDAELNTALDVGIHEALQMVATELSFRGFKCLNQTQHQTDAIAQVQVRGVFVAALLALTDACARPADVVIAAQREGKLMAITLALADRDTRQDSEAEESFQPPVATYRSIEWDDVQALAAADDVALQHTPTQAMLRFGIIGE